MSRLISRLGMYLLLIGCAVPILAQQPTNTGNPVPPLVNFSGVIADVNGKPLTGAVGVTFAIYQEQQGSSPLWLETQNVSPDKTGHYSVTLGSTTGSGIPSQIFVGGEARWLGVQPQGQPEQPRVMLLSVPYALVAGNAQTVGGLPASAFVLAAPSGGAVQNPTLGNTPGPVVGGSGTLDFIPLWTDSTGDLGNSALFQAGASPTAKVGINTTTPAAALDVKGNELVRGFLETPAIANATANQGYNSNPMALVASGFNSSTAKAVTQNFVWQAEPLGNDTATPSGTLNLLFGAGAAAPAETGLHIASNGQINFANGQIFPGAGTITGVTAGTGLQGGGTSGNVTLNIATKSCSTGNAITALPFTCSPFATLGANTFTGNQTVNGNVSATGVVSAASYQIGSDLFGFGSYANSNAFLGFAGNSTTTGFNDTATGARALSSNTTGIYNTASGFQALNFNTTGSWNTASGALALSSNTGGYDNTATGLNALSSNTAGNYNTANGAAALPVNSTGSSNTADGVSTLDYNTTGNNNTAVGYQALFTNSSGSNLTCIGYRCDAGDGLTNATAIGANAVVSWSNAIALGAPGKVSTAAGQVNVGIGTAMPSYRLDINYGDMVVRGLNNFPNAGDAANLYVGDPSHVIQAVNAQGIYIGAYASPNALAVWDGGPVGVATGTSRPSNIFTVGRGEGAAIADSWSTYSSRRWKTNIHTLNGALSKVEHLRGVSYDLKANGKHEIGVIAEEVGAVIPEVVSYDENGSDAKSVDYGRLTALLIEATKEQQSQIRKQQEQICMQQAQIAAQQAKSKLQQAQITQLTSQIQAIQTSLKVNGRSGSGIRSVNVQAPTVHQ